MGYFAGDDGCIYSFWPMGAAKKNGWIKEPRRLMANLQSSGKYLVVNVKAVDGSYITKRVHRLVCEAWHGPAAFGQTASHVDGDWSNNKPDNLIWETMADNHRRKIQHGTDDCGYRNSRSKINKAQLDEIKVLLRGKDLTHEKIGAMFGVNRVLITKIANGYRYGRC